MFSAGRSSPVGRWVRNNLRFARGFFSPARRRVAGAGGMRVALLCGWSLTSGTMSHLAERLSGDGFDVEILELGGLFGKLNTRPIEESGASLVDHLRTALADNERVAIVGHSLGGLIGRYAACCLDGPRYIHTLITLTSPHRGSPAARAARLTPLRWISRGIDELRPESELMRELATKPIPESVYCASLYSESDDLCPRPCSELEIPDGADNVVNVNVGAYGHFEFVTDDRIYRMIKEELRRGMARQAAL